MLKRGVNVGFSGGEKKRNEILQMALFEPAVCILDEMDSGLDIDALRIAADGVNALRSPERAMVVITHYQRLLNYIVPDVVHVMSKGRVVKSGGKDLTLELEESGYAQFEDAPDKCGFSDERCCKDRDRTRAGRCIRHRARPSAGQGQDRRMSAARRSRLMSAFACRIARIEDWKYTDLRALMREVLPLAPAPDAAALNRAAAAVKLRAIDGVRRLVLVDGAFAPDLSDLGNLEKGLSIRPLREVLDAGDGALSAQALRPTPPTPCSR